MAAEEKRPEVSGTSISSEPIEHATGATASNTTKQTHIDENKSEFRASKQQHTNDGDSGGRKRKRHLYNAIRNQMEFYFGDANLSKDRFLRRFVEQDPYVPLEVFLTFNKIKELAQNIQQIAKALSKSQHIQLDETGQKVKRIKPLPEQRDVADRTLYVEALPASASHDWLKEVFSRYGPVAYVSLPHYPNSRKIKEFAFIEFEKSTSVEKAMKAFAEVHGVLSVEPNQMASVRTYQQQQQQHHHHQQQQQLDTKVTTAIDGVETAPVATNANATTITTACKVSHKRTDDDTDTNVPSKRIKLEEQVEQQQVATAAATTTTDCSEQSEQSESNNDNNNTTTTTKESAIDQSTGKSTTTSKKRHRKRKKIPKIKPNIDPSALELKVLPKTTWSSMRNKYLNLQRRTVSETKTKLWRPQQQKQQKPQPPVPVQEAKASNINPHDESSPHQMDSGEESDCSDAADAANKQRQKKAGAGAGGGRSGGVHKMNMNFYGAGGGEIEAEQRAPLFNYEPGLIVRCNLLEPCNKVKEFKADARQYADVKYIDIKEGGDVAFIRAATPAAADEVARKLHCAEMQCTVLRGQDDTIYWQRIEKDRAAKLTKKVRVQKKRGRERVAKLLAKHIKFDDVDEEGSGSPPTGDN